MFIKEQILSSQRDRAVLLLPEATVDTRRGLEPRAQRPHSHTSGPQVTAGDPLRGRHCPGLPARGHFYSEVDLFLGEARTPHGLPLSEPPGALRVGLSPPTNLSS